MCTLSYCSSWGPLAWGPLANGVRGTKRPPSLQAQEVLCSAAIPVPRVLPVQASFEPLGLTVAVAKDRAIESLMQASLIRKRLCPTMGSIVGTKVGKA